MQHIREPQIWDSNAENFGPNKAEENKHSCFYDETEEIKNKYH
jgi:hypothetical protein